MRMSRPTTLLHLLLGLRPAISTSASAIATSRHYWTTPNKPLSILAECHATNLYASNPNTLLNRINTYSTMSQSQPHQDLAQAQSQSQSPLERSSTSTTTTTQPPTQNGTPSSSSTETETKPLLALPSTDSTDITHQLDVNGDGVKLDHLGPLIVNADGTLARISNWAQMTEIERRNTLRVLGKRNKARMDALKAKQAEEEGNGEEGK